LEDLRAVLEALHKNHARDPASPQFETYERLLENLQFEGAQSGVHTLPQANQANLETRGNEFYICSLLKMGLPAATPKVSKFSSPASPSRMAFHF